MLEKMSKMIAEQLNCDASEITSETSFTVSYTHLTLPTNSPV